MDYEQSEAFKAWWDGMKPIGAWVNKFDRWFAENKPAPPHIPQTRLWTGGTKLIARDQQAWLDVGFNSFIYSTGPLLMAQAERETVMASDHDFSNSYLGVKLDTVRDEPPLGDWFDDNWWDFKVISTLRRVVAEAKAAGFKGLALDQELYLPQRPDPYHFWQWDYAGNTRFETETRMKVEIRGWQFAQAIGDFPALIYNFSWPGALETLGKKSDKFDVEKFVYEGWFDGLAAGGLDFDLLDNDVYKTFVPPYTSWLQAVTGQKVTMKATWPQHADRLQSFIWITDGPNAQAAIRNGQSAANIWDRQREDSYIREQIAAARAVHPDLTVYAYNLVGETAPYEGLLR